MAKRAVEDLLGNSGLVTGYARMWPRDVFDYPGKDKKFLVNDLTLLQNPGVYVLYRDDLPYYIGKTDGTLCGRLCVHAKHPGSRYDYFWNFFSVFVIPGRADRVMVEGILIAAMPTANSARPKAFEREKLPKEVVSMMRDQRLHRAKLGKVAQEGK